VSPTSSSVYASTKFSVSGHLFALSPCQ
jgi:hypothetical protein